MVSDKQAVSAYSMRQFGELPLLDNPQLPLGVLNLASAMKTVGQVRLLNPSNTTQEAVSKNLRVKTNHSLHLSNLSFFHSPPGPPVHPYDGI